MKSLKLLFGRNLKHTSRKFAKPEEQSQKFFLLFIFLFFCLSTLFAQTGKIQGKVIFANGKPASSANIFVKTTTKGTVTDSVGNYSLNLKKGNYDLIISILGYQTQNENISIKTDTSVVNVPLTIMTESEENLDAVIIKVSTKMQVNRNHGKLEVNVKNTDFEQTQNVWEGMKKTPLLQVNDDQGVKIFGKDAIVEINGIKTRMSGEQLENYLKSLDPGSVKKIEMEPNPGAAYGSEVDAYINIVLNRGANNYRLGLKTTNGTRSNYFNRSGVNYALNLDKFRLYTNYDFSYSPKKREGSVEQRIGDEPQTRFNTERKSIPRGHNALVNLNFDLGEKDNIDLNNIFAFDNADENGITRADNFNRSVREHSKSHRLQFSQVWKHNFNDTVNLKVGAYEVFKNSESNNFALNNGQNPQLQNVKADIPIYVGFADYTNQNKWGTTSAGLKYRDISVQNDNANSFGGEEFSAPYHYNEKIVSAYISHKLDISKRGNLSFGLRSESAIIDYKFNALTSDESFSAHPRYTNFLYNVQYSWSTKAKRYYNLAFRKSIHRPDYSALNPFQQISNDIIYSAGDTNLDPAQFNVLSFYTYKGRWVFYGRAGYLKDFISNFFQVKEDHITNTYRNFRDVYLVAGGARYRKSFFKGKWSTKTNAELSYFELKDPHFEVGKSTPKITLSSNNSIKIAKNLTSDIDFTLYTAYKGGVINQHGNSRLDLSLTKKFNEHFTAILYAHDIFKTNRSWYNTTIPNYFYETKEYPDTRSIGLTLKYSVTGKAYKAHNRKDPEDSAIDRLK